MITLSSSVYVLCRFIGCGCCYRAGTVKVLIVKLIHGMILPCLKNPATSNSDEVLYTGLHSGLQRLQGIRVLLVIICKFVVVIFLVVSVCLSVCPVCALTFESLGRPTELPLTWKVRELIVSGKVGEFC